MSQPPQQRKGKQLPVRGGGPKRGLAKPLLSTSPANPTIPIPKPLPQRGTRTYTNSIKRDLESMQTPSAEAKRDKAKKIVGTSSSVQASKPDYYCRDLRIIRVNAGLLGLDLHSDFPGEVQVDNMVVFTKDPSMSVADILAAGGPILLDLESHQVSFHNLNEKSASRTSSGNNSQLKSWKDVRFEDLSATKPTALVYCGFKVTRSDKETAYFPDEMKILRHGFQFGLRKWGSFLTDLDIPPIIPDEMKQFSKLIDTWRKAMERINKLHSDKIEAGETHGCAFGCAFQQLKLRVVFVELPPEVVQLRDTIELFHFFEQKVQSNPNQHQEAIKKMAQSVYTLKAKFHSIFSTAQVSTIQLGSIDQPNSPFVLTNRSQTDVIKLLIESALADADPDESDALNHLLRVSTENFALVQLSRDETLESCRMKTNTTESTTSSSVPRCNDRKLRPDDLLYDQHVFWTRTENNIQSTNPSNSDIDYQEYITSVMTPVEQRSRLAFIASLILNILKAHQEYFPDNKNAMKELSYGERITQVLGLQLQLVRMGNHQSLAQRREKRCCNDSSCSVM